MRSRAHACRGSILPATPRQQQRPRRWPRSTAAAAGDVPSAASRPAALQHSSTSVTADGHPGITGRRSLLHKVAASAAVLLVAPALSPATAAAAGAASLGTTNVERAAASCRGCVAAIAAVQSGGPSAAVVEQQLGSGIVWGSQGHIVTSYAPITRVQRQSPSTQLLVTLTAADGSTHQLPAQVVAKDPSRDLLVLLVAPPAAGLQPVPVGTSAQARVGQDAYLLGALPGGAPPSITSGVISAVGRSIPASNNQAIGGVLQTDVEVDQQSLGGALLDSSGRLLGMPVVSYVKPGFARSNGVNFALPVDMLRDVVPKLIVYGSAADRR